MTTTTPSKLLTVEDLAERLNVIPVTIRRWLRRRELTGIRTPAGWRFEEKDVQAWIDRHREQTMEHQQ